MLAFQMRDVQILACLVVLKVISTKFDAETSLFTFSEVCVRVMHVTAARVFASRVMGSLLGVFLSSLCKPLIVEVGARRRAGEVKKILEKKNKKSFQKFELFSFDFLRNGLGNKPPPPLCMCIFDLSLTRIQHTHTHTDLVQYFSPLAAT